MNANIMLHKNSDSGHPPRSCKCSRASGLALIFVLLLSLCGCGSSTRQSENLTENSSALSTQTYDSEPASATLLSSRSEEELFTERDLSGDYALDYTICLSDSGSFSDCASVTVDGGRITICQAGTYGITGSLTDGCLIVDAQDAKVQLVLMGCSLSCSDSAALLVIRADKLFITTADGTENVLSSTADFGEASDTEEYHVDGAVFTRCDTTLNGAGVLAVTCPNGHGIVCKKDLKVTSGTWSITAGEQALSGKNSIRIDGGTLNLTGGTDALHADNEEDADKGYVAVLDGILNLTAGTDGIDATGSVTVTGGTVTITAGDDGIHTDSTLLISGGTLDIQKSYEGLEGPVIEIDGGSISILASDDGLNASDGSSNSGMGMGFGGGNPFGTGNTSDSEVRLVINGGTLTVNASGDGLDSNGSLTVTGGTVLVSGPTSGGDGAIDYQTSAVISGGTLAAAGSVGMAENFGADSTQCAALVSFNGTIAGGTELTVSDSAGNVLLQFTPAKDYGCVVISCPELQTGSTYTVTAGTCTSTITFSSVIASTGTMFSKNDQAFSNSGRMSPADSDRGPGSGSGSMGRPDTGMGFQGSSMTRQEETMQST